VNKVWNKKTIYISDVDILMTKEEDIPTLIMYECKKASREMIKDFEHTKKEHHERIRSEEKPRKS
jgi:hypothetical protein